MTVWQTIPFDNGWGNRNFLTQIIRLRAIAPLNRITSTHKTRSPMASGQRSHAAATPPLLPSDGGMLPRCPSCGTSALGCLLPAKLGFPHRPSLPPQGSSLARERPKFRKHDSAAFYLVTAVPVKKKNWPSLNLALPIWLNCGVCER